MKYLKVLACKVMFRELSYLAALSDNVCDITWLNWGLHNEIGAINKVLTDHVAALDAHADIHTTFPPYGGDFDAVLIGYGLCSNGIVGLRSQRYTLVIPRAHDCITLFLGSKERYQQVFAEAGGTYFYTPGWIENSAIISERRREYKLAEYGKQFGEEAAEDILEMYDEWVAHYSRLGLVSWQEFAEREFAVRTADEARSGAEYAGWEVEHLRGDSSLLSDFIAGNWDNERFLVVPPGETVRATYGPDIIGY
ncbi:MAG: DUF1638 domain-containing protein [Coriobacteriales bacterium]|nr:DUF1638 domain-containing protein [Coriobacteriales bacterium]